MKIEVSYIIRGDYKNCFEFYSSVIKSFKKNLSKNFPKHLEAKKLFLPLQPLQEKVYWWRNKRETIIENIG